MSDDLTPTFLPPALIEPDGFNPECTPGRTIGPPGDVTALCGCGWAEEGFPSRRQALKAQKLHRFPPRGQASDSGTSPVT